MGRAPCCDKDNVKRGPWSPEEDAKLKSYIDNQGTGGNWIALPQKIGLKRCGKSCRLRWLNYLRPNIKHGGFSEEEDNIICSLYISIGSRWSIIAAQLPGRTDNDIKNYWNTRLKKKLIGQQRKDHQKVRRSCGSKKDQAKRDHENIGDAVADGDDGSRTVYWVEPSLPVYPISQADDDHADDPQASIRKLLIKLGGRFGNGDGSSYPVTQKHLYDDSANLMAPSMNTGSFEDGFGDPADRFAIELDEMLRCSPMKLEGLDCFYGSGMSMGDNRTSTSESADWSEVSPLVYPPLVPSYQGMQQLMFDDPVHLGML